MNHFYVISTLDGFLSVRVVFLLLSCVVGSYFHREGFRSSVRNTWLLFRRFAMCDLVITNTVVGLHHIYMLLLNFEFYRRECLLCVSIALVSLLRVLSFFLGFVSNVGIQFL